MITFPWKTAVERPNSPAAGSQSERRAEARGGQVQCLIRRGQCVGHRPPLPRQTTLREGLDDDLTTHDCLHRQFIAVEQAHTDEWVDVRSVHGDAAWSAILEDRRLVNVKQTCGTISQQRASTATPRQTKSGDASAVIVHDVSPHCSCCGFLLGASGGKDR
jgi:hypothetical protein